MMWTLTIKLYPKEIQEVYLSNIFGCHRKVFNLALDKSIKEYKEKGNKSFTKLAAFTNFFHQELLKNDEYAYLREHNTKILKDALNNLSKAYTNFFNKKTGFPNFKKKTNEQSIGLYDEAFSKKVFYTKNKMFISKAFGYIDYRTSKENKALLEGYKDKIVRITITKSPAGTYEASVLIDLENFEKLNPESTNAVGFDLGINTFIFDSNGEEKENLKSYRKTENRRKRLQRGLSKKVKGSKNRDKARVKLAKFEEKIVNKKTNYLHSITKKMVHDNQIIVMEDLNVKGMMRNHNLAKSIQELSLGEFRRELTYKSEWNGKTLIFVDRYFPSSKKCSSCGHIKKGLKLSEREWVCPTCGVVHKRDFNSAVNMLVEGLRIYKEKIGCRAAEFTLADSPLMDDRAYLEGILKSNGWVKQEGNVWRFDMNFNGIQQI